MNTVACGLAVIWVCGLIFFAMRILNYTRLIYNNLAPSDYYGDPSQFGDRRIFWTRFRITPPPAFLTDAGKRLQRGAVRNYWMTWAWIIAGAAIIAAVRDIY